MKPGVVPSLFPGIKNKQIKKRKFKGVKKLKRISQSDKVLNSQNKSDDLCADNNIQTFTDLEKIMLNETFVNEIEVSETLDLTKNIERVASPVSVEVVNMRNISSDNNSVSKCSCNKALNIEKYINDSDAVHFYTGLECYEKFLLVYRSLGPAVNHLNYVYGKPPDTITPINRFFLTLIILRERKTYYELSLSFELTEKQVYNIFITWIRFMSLQWKEIPQWPDKELVKFYCPHDFKRKFPSVRTIVDATEIPIKRPGAPIAQQSTFSTYKNKSTVKVVVGATPGGLISYLSPAYGGSTTDRQIIERSELLKMLEPGDSIMADKGFDIEDLLAAYKATLNIPTFFRKRNQISAQTLKKDRKLSSKRVHIERLIGLAKTYKILKGPLNATEIILADDIIFVCFMLCNFRKPIVNEYA